MCLAVPGKVEKVSRGNHAVVNFSGVKKKVNIELVSGVKKNDWVTVHAGFAIGKLSESDAKQTLKLFNEQNITTNK